MSERLFSYGTLQQDDVQLASFGRLLDPLTQDACAFYEDHSLFDDYTGVVYDNSEGDRIAEALGPRKAIILQNHGILTVGRTVDEAAWLFITADQSAHAQLLAANGMYRKLWDDQSHTPHGADDQADGDSDDDDDED